MNLKNLILLSAFGISSFGLAMDGHEGLTDALSIADKSVMTETAPAMQKAGEVTIKLKQYLQSQIDAIQKPAVTVNEPKNEQVILVNKSDTEVNIKASDSLDVTASQPVTVGISKDNNNNTILEITNKQTNVDAQNQDKQNFSQKWFSCQWLTKKQALAFGIGAIALIAIGGVTYILYKNGTLKRIGDEIKAHPYISSAVIAPIIVMTTLLLAYPESRNKGIWLLGAGVAAAAGATAGVIEKGNWLEKIKGATASVNI